MVMKTLCPACRSEWRAPITYGLPVAAVDLLEAEEKIWIGGCWIEPDAPTRHCFACDEDWRPRPVKSPRTRRDDMAVTALDEQTALVVVDIQRGVIGLATFQPTADIVERCSRLANAFRARSKPVVLVNVEWRPEIMLQPRADAKPPARTLTPDFAKLADELEADHARDIFITKRQWGAFYGTELDLQLRRRKVTGIVMCGIATSIGVESTARDAFERGYNLTFASDAMTDLFEDAHRNALTRIFQRIGEIGMTDEIIAKLGC